MKHTHRKSIPFLLVSILVHATLFGILLLSFVPTQYRLPGPAKGVKNIIEVSAVSQQKITAVIQARQRRLQQIKLAKQRKLAAIKRAKQRRLAAIKRAKMLNLQAQRRQAKLKQLKVQQKLLEQKLQQQALLASEQQYLKKKLKQKAQLEHQRMQRLQQSLQSGVIDRYKAQLKAAIEQQWFLPPGTDTQLECRLRVRLAPGGVVLSVTLLSSSGNAAVDRSAKTAIMQASPLPVPKNPALFDAFRVLNLTMSPKDIVPTTT